MKSATASPLAETVSQAAGTVLVLFGGEWNPATRGLKAQLAERALPAGAKLVYVDVDDDVAAPAFAGLRCIPTLQVWKGGQKSGTLEFAVPGPDLDAWVVANA